MTRIGVLMFLAWSMSSSASPDMFSVNMSSMMRSGFSLEMMSRLEAPFPEVTTE